MYAMMCIRPDIAYAVSQVSQFNSLPSITHEKAVQRILPYLHKKISALLSTGRRDWFYKPTAM
jgi:hypothetical protein